jgi:putative methyltransferase (TIGR04325 family)
MTDGEQYVTLHSMGVALTPYRIFQQKQFIDSLAKLGYRLIDQWKNEDFACVIPLDLDKSVNAFSGMYLTLEESARK